MADDYELLPTDEIEHLRREIDKLKGKPFGADTDTLMGSIRQLQRSIDALVKVFAEANEIITEDKFVAPKDEVNPVEKTAITRLELQNEKIAKGMVNLANMMREQEENHAKEHQEFIKKKEPKPVNVGIAPSGLAPISNQEVKPIIKVEPVEKVVKQEEKKIVPPAATPLKVPEAPKENMDDIPEPPKP